MSCTHKSSVACVSPPLDGKLPTQEPPLSLATSPLLKGVALPVLPLQSFAVGSAERSLPTWLFLTSSATPCLGPPHTLRAPKAAASLASLQVTSSNSSSPPANPLSRNPHTSVSLCFSPLLLPKAASLPKSRMNKLTPVALKLHNSQASFYLSCSNAPLSMELKSTKCTFPSFPKKSNFKN